MRGFWRGHGGFDAERELRAQRPQPSDELTRSIVRRMDGRRSGTSSFRAAVAVGLSTLLLAALMGTGGVGYAGEPGKRAVAAVKKVFVPKGVVVAKKKSSAMQQYLAPTVVKPKPKKKLRGVVAKAKPRFTG